MIQITEYQQRILEMLSNQTPIEAATFSYTYPGDGMIDSAEDCELHNMEFVQSAQLVEWGLCIDSSKTKSEVADAIRKKLPQREVYFISPTPRTKTMFRDTGRKEWIN